MALTRIDTMPAFRRAYRKKTDEMRQVIDKTILQLRTNHRHPGLNAHKMWGHPGVWEAYMDRANRLTFHWEGDTIVLRNHCNHDILKRSP